MMKLLGLAPSQEIIKSLADEKASLRNMAKWDIRSALKTILVPFHGLNEWMHLQLQASSSKNSKNPLIQRAANWSGLMTLAGMAVKVGTAAVVAAKVFGIAAPILAAASSGVGLPIAIAAIVALGVITAYSAGKMNKHKVDAGEPTILISPMDRLVKEIFTKNLEHTESSETASLDDGLSISDVDDVEDDVDLSIPYGDDGQDNNLGIFEPDDEALLASLR